MKVSLISTVKDAGPFIGEFLESVRAQTRAPDEVVIVDGGSTDATLDELRADSEITLIEKPGANISAGRVAAVRAATHEVIAVSDADCVLEPDWLERLLVAIEEGADVAMGFYRPLAGGFFETCSAAVHLPDAEELSETTFMPSSRSVAYRREAYEAAGGYPEWLEVGEDMWIDHRFRELGMKMTLVSDAIAQWRVRPTLGETWRQYFGYAKGDAIAGMYPERHALRFAVYSGAFLFRRRKLGKALLAAGGAAYALKPVKRALKRLDDPAEKAAACVVVPALMAFTDFAKMAGYLSGLLKRRQS
ncbi:MAG: glycosyltransferase [Actinomycetota bacterium]